jgi:hypothetical protein
MKKCLIGSVVVWLLVSLSAIDSSAGNTATAQTAPGKHSAVSDLPLTLFQQIDQRLSLLDADNQALGRKRLTEEAVRSKSARTKMLRRIQQSPEFRGRARTVNQLLTITARAETSCESRRQRYGARLFRDLHARFAAMKVPIAQSASARTLTSFDRDQKSIENRMLPAIVQFQAMSGGYAGLACRSGSRACCQSRLVGRGRLAVRGCTWTCASKLPTTSNVFLGPLIPKSVITVKNAVPEHQNRNQKSIIAAHTSHKQKPVERATAPANRQSAAPGSD